ncbi:MAG: nucleoside transporter C-terminal domain-containing protein [Bacteroidia bacterium]|nr:nucleoside transporter C-terminal domain-containing protein [Bacteroidia bacterium]
MKLLHVLLLNACLVLGLYCPAQNLDFPVDSLYNTWTSVSEDAGQADTLMQLTLRQGGRFSRVTKERTEEGQWLIRQDSLYLLFEFLPVQGSADSVVYQAAGESAVLVYFQQGKEIARQTLADGLGSARRTEAYHLAMSPAGDLLLTSLKGTDTLEGPVRLLPEAFVWMDIVRGTLGLIVMVVILWALSANRKAIDWKLVGSGMALQLLFAVLVLKVPFVKIGFSWVADRFVEILGFTRAGTEFLFGKLVDAEGFAYIFAFQVLPTVIFFSALMSILYYLGILQRVVFGFAWVMSKTMRLSGAESLSTAGNIFLGQTEAPLLIKPYLKHMTRSEIMTVMCGGMATIAGGVFAAYVGYLGGTDPEMQRIFATHLLTASVMSAPAAIVAAKMLLPETETINTDLTIPRDRIGSNLLDAIANGTSDGLRLAVNVGVMLLVFTALIKMCNYFLADGLGEITGLNDWVTTVTQGRYTQFNLQYLFGLLFAPMAWLLGVPAEDMLITGQLLGEKTIINEFVAYTTLGTAQTAGLITHYKSVIIATYALCGFANFASIGIQIGGIGALEPSQRRNLSELGIKALIGGTMASFFTAAIAGMLAGI